jgi:GTP-binding protein
MFKYRTLTHHVHNVIARSLYTYKTERNFVDSIKCVVTGGKGGNGSVSFRREKHVERGGPDGGDGGRGGNITIRTNPNIRSLSHVGYYQVAKSGVKGGQSRSKGKDGEDITVEVPVGTVIRDLDTEQLIGDVSTPELDVIVARGGVGGKGNVHFATSMNRTPRYATQGKSGEKRHLELVLKTIADVGLVGYPNAGKSTFMGTIDN